MENIRRATKEDITRIAEILVFNNRMYFYPIFQDEGFSFKFFNVTDVANEYLETPGVLDEMFVYDDGIIRGFVHIKEREVKKLYVDHFFQNRGIGSKLFAFAVDKGAEYLWALEKNAGARRFYERFGFTPTGEWKYEEGTTQKLIVMSK